MKIGDSVTASLERGLESVGGILSFRENGLLFTPHTSNAHLGRAYIPYLQIFGVIRRNWLSIIPIGLSLFMKDGAEYKFNVRRRDAIITLILSLNS